MGAFTNQGPQYRAQILGLLLERLPKEGPPIYGISQILHDLEYQKPGKCGSILCMVYVRWCRIYIINSVSSSILGARAACKVRVCKAGEQSWKPSMGFDWITSQQRYVYCHILSQRSRCVMYICVHVETNMHIHNISQYPYT